MSRMILIGIPLGSTIGLIGYILDAQQWAVFLVCAIAGILLSQYMNTGRF